MKADEKADYVLDKIAKHKGVSILVHKDFSCPFCERAIQILMQRRKGQGIPLEEPFLLIKISHTIFEAVKRRLHAKAITQTTLPMIFLDGNLEGDSKVAATV